MDQQEKARKITCRMCHAGAGEKCFNMAHARTRAGLAGLRIKGVHQIRVEDAKAREQR